MNNLPSFPDQPLPTQPVKPAWHQSAGLAFGMFLLSLFTVLGLIFGQLAIRFTAPQNLLILNSSGCQYLHYHQIGTAPYVSEGRCTVVASYREHWLDQGGTVKLADRTLELRPDQIYTTETLVSASDQRLQLQMNIALILSLIAWFGCVVWLFKLMFE